MIDFSEAKKVLSKGELVVYPTETAYAIGCNALDESAIDRVYEAKSRPREKGLTVICRSLEQAENYTRLSDSESKLATNFMPGPLTLVTDKRSNLPENLNKDFVFRVSSKDVCRELAEDFPIVATSANISGQDTSYSIKDISENLLKHVSTVVDKGELDFSETSTIAEIDGKDLKIHREGPISKEEMEAVLSD